MAEQRQSKSAYGRNHWDLGALSGAEERLIEACRKGEVARFGDGARPGHVVAVLRLPDGNNPARWFAEALPDEVDWSTETKRAVVGFRREGWTALESFGRPLHPRPAQRVWIRHVSLARAIALPVQLPAEIRWLKEEPAQNARGRRIPSSRRREIVDYSAMRRWLSSIRIRAELVRFLLLGGDSETPVHEKGVQMMGAWISGVLDLSACPDVRRLIAWDTRFDKDIIFIGANIATISLEGSAIAGIQGDGVCCNGSMFLRNNLHSQGKISFCGATIKGNLECDGSRFGGDSEISINCDDANIGGSIYFRNNFVSYGKVWLRGIKVSGNLECDRGIFINNNDIAFNFESGIVRGDVFLRNGFYARGEVLLRAARIGRDLDFSNGQFINPGQIAIYLENARIRASLIFLSLREVRGTILAASASAGTLVDDNGCWANAEAPDNGSCLILHGFKYRMISGTAGPTDAATRIRWLRRQVPAHLAGDFRPEPWERIIKVLREMGHTDDAKHIAIEKQNMLRVAGKIPFGARSLHWAYGKIIGFGYRPFLTVGWMTLAWCISALIYAIAAAQGLMGPTSPLVFLNEHVAQACRDHWTTCAQMPGEYTTFQPLFYSLDLLLPVVDLQQARDWAPILDGGRPFLVDPGSWVRFWMWLEIGFGWVTSLLLVAVLSGLAKKD